MGDILGIFIVVIFYAVAISASNKSKKKKSAKQSADTARSARFDQAFAGKEPDRAQREGSRKAVEEARKARAAQRDRRQEQLEHERRQEQLEWAFEQAHEGDDPCHDEAPRVEGDWRRAQPGMRLKPATQADMAYAAEGDDPCHTGGVERPEHDPVYDSPIYAPALNTQALASQVLSGVIMSEVLKRPQQRIFERKLRRGA